MVKTELDKFIQNLKSIGCPYTINHQIGDSKGETISFLGRTTLRKHDNQKVVIGKHIVITVAQAHFIFSYKSKVFLGVESDEMGVFTPRIIEDGK